MRDLPQFGIQLPPYFVGRMIPRPMHIQGKFRQGIEPLDLRGQKVVDGVADADWFAHDLVHHNQPATGDIMRACRLDDLSGWQSLLNPQLAPLPETAEA